MAPRRDEPWRDGVPVVDLAIAAGDFGPEQWAVEDLSRAEEWISWDGAPPFRQGMFVARIVGRSMEPLIPDGSHCLFRLSSLSEAGSKPMLVRLAGADPGASRFTVKDVESERRANHAGVLEVCALVLKPRNAAYPVMRVEGDSMGSDVHVIAELVQVLGQ